MTENVVDLGAYRIARNSSDNFRRRIDGECLHKQWLLEDCGNIVSCKDCGKQLGAFWALNALIDEYNTWVRRYVAQAEKLREDSAANLHLTAARLAEKAWRSRKMVPCCPHCGEGIAAGDGFGHSLINKRIDDARRADRARAKAAAATPPAGATP